MFQDTYNATTGEWTRVPARLVNREGVAMVIPEDAPLPPGYDEGPPPEAPAYDELAEQSWRADEMVVGAARPERARRRRPDPGHRQRDQYRAAGPSAEWRR